jgi:hypothetical protein
LTSSQGWSTFVREPLVSCAGFPFQRHDDVVVGSVVDPVTTLVELQPPEAFRTHVRNVPNRVPLRPKSIVWSHGHVAVPATPGGTGMVVSFVQLIPPSLENSTSALPPPHDAENRVIAIWFGLAGLMAMLGSLPPEELEFRLGSIVNTPAAAAALTAERAEAFDTR